MGIPTWGLIGGSERYAAAAVSGLIELGHRLTLLCARRAEPPPLETGRGLGVLVEPAFGDSAPGRAALDRLQRRLVEASPEVVLLLGACAPRTLARLLDVAPVVRFVQDHTLFCPGRNKVLEDGGLCREPMGPVCLERYLLGGGCTGYRPAALGSLGKALASLGKRLLDLDLHRRAACLLVASRYMRRELLAVGFAPDRIALLPYFAPPSPGPASGDRLPEATRRFLEASEAPLLLTPARLTLPDKGIDRLLTALGQVRGRFRAVIAGSGPAEEWLRAKARDEGLAERVHFSGWLDPPALGFLLERCRALVCPSMWSEPFGLVGLEAMACARPAVAFEVGGIPEWLEDGVTGLSVERGDCAGLARAIDRLVADPDRADEMGRAGRARLEREFGREEHMGVLERILGDAR